MPSSICTYNQADLYRVIRSDLFAKGSATAPDMVGLELELFPVVREPGSGIAHPAPLGDHDDRGPTLMALFDALVGRGGWRLTEEDGSIVVEREAGGRITLEPAGQIEYSGPPHPDARHALDDLETVVAEVTAVARDAGIEIVTRGYNNICCEETIPLQVRKARYRAMDRHFEHIGPFGRKMMRATCSLQINLDFGGPSVAAERWRLANMIAPSLNALFANSPHVHEGLVYRSFRHEIWLHADPTRTGRLYDRPDLDPVADYLRFALDATVMMIRDDAARTIPTDAPFTFRQWIAGTTPYGFPDWEDWRLHLTTLFPDVRARGWMELRSIDALPAAWRSVPVAMATTLLYDGALRADALELLERRERHAVAGDHEHGGYWRSDYETGMELLELAIPAIDDPGMAQAARRYHAEFCAEGRVPADITASEMYAPDR